jgi:hypothetical protein
MGMSKVVQRIKRHRSELLETVVPDFSHSQPFSFLCNARLDQKPWTPTRIRKTDHFGKLLFVRAIVTTDNLDNDIQEIVECWTQRNIHVHLVFPVLKEHPTCPGEHVFGMPLRDCYMRVDGGWKATAAFKDAVAECYDCDPMVKVCR